MSSPPTSPAPPRERPVLLLGIDLTRGRISVQGDLDRAHVDQFIAAVDVLQRSSAAQWLIDAAGITFCDAGGLRGLLHAHAMAVRAGRTLVVTRPSRQLTRLLTLVDPAALHLVAVDRPA